MSEVAASLGPGVKPGAVLLSVGGGGLLCGVVQGLEDVGWLDVPIIAMETVGADCFNAAVKAGKLVTLDDITRSGSKVTWLILISRRSGSHFLFSASFPVRPNVSEPKRSASKLSNTVDAATCQSSRSW